GRVLVPLNEREVREVIRICRGEGVQAVATCLLNSYVNPTHERRTRELLEAELPGVYLAISSELSPQFREFERTSTTAVAAYVGPVFRQYVRRLVDALAADVQPAPRLYIMQSSGGMVSADLAVERPHLTVESGPAAGVAATLDLGERLGLKDLISFDMGGTTAKASLIRDGKPSMVNILEVGGEASGVFGAPV